MSPGVYSEPADPAVREDLHLPPKSYAEAAEQPPSNADSESGSDIDEDLIKESPPRSSGDASGARPLGEILDEDEEQRQTYHRPFTPSPVRRKPLPRTYADAAATNGTSRRSSTQSIEKEVPSDEADKSPLRRVSRRIPSATIDGGSREGHDSLANKLIYEKLDGKHGDTLTTVKPEDKTPSATIDGGSREGRDGLAKKLVFEKLDGKHDDTLTTVQPKDETRSASVDGDSREGHDSLANKLVYEQLDGKHGDTLTTVKPKDEDDTPASDDKPASKPVRHSHSRTYSKDDLVSGRHAGAGWETSSIHWAPLNVPLKRRLQTLVVLLHTLSIAGFVTLFFFLCAIPILWPILVPYLLYVLFSNAASSGELSYRSPWLRRLPIWSLFASYFPARLHRTQVLPPTRKYLFGYHPHGIISHGAFAAFGTEALGFSQLFPGITNTLLTLDTNFRIPLYRDYALRMGLASVSRESCENILTRGGPNGEGMGRGITIVVGGAREALDAQPGMLKLVLNKRKGFIKMAIRTGADLVPVLAFGENELYQQVQPDEHPWIHKGQLLVKRSLGFTIPLFHARGVFNYDVGLLPYRRPVNIVVGRPIQVVQNKNPDKAYVDEIHARYVAELLGIWDEWKDTFGRGTKGLEIVE